MWPTALQMTRDECRGVLRRLELESYSNVISAFRAQGSLNESKAKILEDLRNVFHISQDRHRAEARRAANDEQLATVAESISGPNTYQEWSREGRRNFPLLARSAPFTAVSGIANSVAEEVASKNATLPYPCDTVVQRDEHVEENVETTPKPVVLVDPYLPIPPVTEYPPILEEKKNLKRNLVETSTHNINSVTPIKKRNTEDGDSSTICTSPIQPQLLQPPQTHIQQLYHNHSKTQSRHKKIANKKSPAKPKINATPTKSQKKAAAAASVAATAANELSSVSNTNSNQKIGFTFPIKEQIQSPQSPGYSVASTSSTGMLSVENILPTPTQIPQIATSKKDISKNVSKLNLPKIIASHGKIQTINVAEYESKTDKLSTPVQKYIVEDRSPLTTTNPPTTIDAKHMKLKTILPGTAASLNHGKFVGIKTFKTSSMEQSINTTSPQIFNVVDSSSPSSTPSYIQHMSPNIINLNNATAKVDSEGTSKIISSKMLPMILSSTNKLDLGSLTNQAHTSSLQKSPNLVKGSIQSFPLKQKIQLNNQQIINSLKIPTLKNLPNRKSVQIFSSSNGKMFIQSADSSKPIGKLNPLSAQRGSLTVTSGTTNSTNTPPGRIAIQKVQIIQPAHGTIQNSVTNKQISITKPNMIFMQTGGGTTTTRPMPLIKSSKISPILPSASDISSSTPSSYTSSSNTGKGQNVFVIGSMQSGVTTAAGSSPIKQQNNVYESNQLSGSNMITEDTPIDILNTPIIVADGDGDGDTTISKETIIDNSLENLETEINSHISTGNNNDNSANNGTSAVAAASAGNIVIDVTDWEMALDQEANKSRTINSLAQRTTSSIVDQSSNDDEQIYVDDGEFSPVNDDRYNDDHYNDVIEEETIEVDDDQLNTTADVIQYDESYESMNEDIDDNIAIEYIDEDEVQEMYEQKTNLTSVDQGTSNANNIVFIKGQMQHEEDIIVDTNSENEMENSQSSEIRVSVEEITSTSQMNSSSVENAV